MKPNERDLEYRRRGADRWLARVYVPGGAGPFPAVLDVHGGAWSGGDRTSNVWLDRFLAENGLLVVAIDFRIAPANAYPAMQEDLNYATRWLKLNATSLGARPGPLGAIGTSSGGHMAALSAVRPHDPRYSALPLPGGAGIDATLDYVVACWPPIDPYERYQHARQTGRGDLVRNTLGCFNDEATMQAASPTRIVAAGQAQAMPPMLVVQGTADGNIPMPMIERFATAYRAAGGSLQLEVFEGQPHGFAGKPGPDAERAKALILDFIADQVAVPSA